MFNIYLVTIGFDIIFATVNAKNLRIYHIFNKFGKVNRICSDQGLFLLISVAVSVRIVLLIVWNVFYASTVVNKEQYISQSAPPYYMVREHCLSQHFEVWIVVHVGYFAILMTVMVVLAILTKIKRQEFKDSKKINSLSLVVALVFNMCTGVLLWLIFRLVGTIVPSRVVVGVGTTTAATLCLVFLILSKIAPLVLHDCQCLGKCHDVQENKLC